jgi:TAT (twin-arginine translocation) pathway-exported protein
MSETNSHPLSRRDFLKLAGTAAGALAAEQMFGHLLSGSELNWVLRAFGAEGQPSNRTRKRKRSKLARPKL